MTIAEDFIQVKPCPSDWYVEYPSCPYNHYPTWYVQPRMGWKCPNCGAGVSPDEKVCPECKPVKYNIEINYGDNDSSTGGSA